MRRTSARRATYGSSVPAASLLAGGLAGRLTAADIAEQDRRQRAYVTASHGVQHAAPTLVIAERAEPCVVCGDGTFPTFAARVWDGCCSGCREIRHERGVRVIGGAL